MTRPREMKLALLGAALLSVAVLATAVVGRLRAPRPNAELAEAVRLIESRSYGHARQILLPLVAAGDRSEPAYRLGECELALGRSNAAIEVWQQIPHGTPRCGAARLAAGREAMRRGRLSEAVRLYEESLAEPGEHRDEAERRLFNALRFEGCPWSVRALVRRRLAAGADPIATIRRGWEVEVEPPPIAAVRDYLVQAERDAPSDPAVQLGLAAVDGFAGRFHHALLRLDTWLAAHPDDSRAWRMRLELAHRAGESEEARRSLTHVAADDLDPDDRLELAAAFAAARGDRARERKQLEAIAKGGRGRRRALERLAELAVLDGDANRAAKLRTEASGLDGKLLRYGRLLGTSDTRKSAAELAALADALGRRDEAEAWVRLAGRRTEDPKPIEAPSLAELRSEPPFRALVEQGAEPLTFEDRAAAAGLDFVHQNGASFARQLPETMSGGVALLDYDCDGRLDVYCVQGGTFPPAPDAPLGDRLFRNKGDGTFEDATERSGLSKLAGGYGHGVAVGDVDNDGDPDFFVTRWRRYALYRNRGDGTFEDATEAFGLGGDRGWPTSAAFADLDGDGDLDLYVCHYLEWNPGNPRLCRDESTGRNHYCNPADFPALSDRLFRNEDGRFSDVTKSAGIVDRDGRGLGVLAADLDDDGRVDLFVANDMSPAYLWRNMGDMRFEEVGQAAGLAVNADGQAMAGIGVACGDVDGDGRLDVVQTNFFGEATRLYRNLGGGLFTDVTTASGLEVSSRDRLGFGVALVDLDDDGFLDLATANGHVNDGTPRFPHAMRAQVFRGLERGRFRDVTDSSGASLSVERLGRGLASGDIDGDGRVDLLLLGQNEPLAYLRNESRRDGRFLSLRLEGRVSNRDGVGARVIVSGAFERKVLQRVGGGSYQSAPGPWLHVGLGKSTEPVQVEIRWPSGRVDRFDRLHVDSDYRIVEGAPNAVLLSPK